MAKVPVYLEAEKWGQVITAIAMQHPLVAEISMQIAQFNQMVAKANGEADAAQGHSVGTHPGIETPREPASEPQTDRSHSSQQRSKGSTAKR